MIEAPPTEPAAAPHHRGLMLLRFQLTAIGLVLGVAVMVLIAGIRDRGPLGCGRCQVLDPKDVLSDLLPGAPLPIELSLDIIGGAFMMFGQSGVIVPVLLAFLGVVTLGLPMRRNVPQRRRSWIAGCSAFLAVYAAVLLTPFGAEVIRWMFD
jgi:hypothetical protein